jgi:hypothetical protein
MNKPQKNGTKWSEKLGPYWTWLFPSVALFIKVITTSNIPGHIWPGSDAESYLDAVNGLVTSGFFSDAEKLQYFPAGYPVIIWLLAKISISNALLLLGIFQSLVFAFASWFFVKNINFGKFSRLAPWVAFLVSFNPTLALSSLAIGYESLVASLLMISLALLFQENREKRIFRILVFSILSGLAAFMQPRYLATSIIVLVIWSYRNFGARKSVKFVSLALIVIMMSPLVLGLRNKEATGKFFVSNNLGVTMNVGAGPQSSGGYTNKSTGVDCPENVKTDNQKVICILKWYVANPLQTARLSYNKTLYFFSPWSGPLANGTMARNPWLKINPVQQSAKTQDGWKVIYSGFGKTVSWIWLLASFGLMIWGAIWLWKSGGETRNLALFAGIPVLISWIIALGTIGDHRFRIPVMVFIFILQVSGVRGLSKKPLILKPKAKKR